MARNDLSTFSSEPFFPMTRFLARLLIFSIPIAVYCGFVALIDPFDYLRVSSVISPTVKASTARALNECFWKMNQYDHHPVSSILLGDSRMDAMPTGNITRVANREYFNFAFGGGTLNELIDAFWFSTGRTRLRDVYIGLNLNVYNDYNYTARTATYDSIGKNPALYFVNRTVLQAALYETYSQITATDLKIGVPQMSREEFWRQQIGPLTSAYYTNFVYPVKYHKELERIAAYCRQNHVNLGFIIFPTHVELQARIRDFHLEHANAQFRDDLAALGPTYDFDYPNGLTELKDNFRDPYHYGPALADIIIGEVWQGRSDFSRHPQAHQQR
jgi:hypothetical protein